MAVIKCSLTKDGRLKVKEVLEFDRGDVIQINKSVSAQKLLSPYFLIPIIPCTGQVNCFMPPQRFDRDKVVVKKP